MRFIINKPWPGDTRVLTKFAWFPKISGNTVIWLEKYKSHQTFWGGSDCWVEERVELL